MESDFKVNIEEAFGKEFAEKFKSPRLPKLVFSDEHKKLVIKLVQETLSSEKPILTYNVDGNEYQVILVETQQELTISEGKYNYSLRGIKHGANWISIDAKEQSELEGFKPDNGYILVGKLKVSPRKTGTGNWYNFRLDGFIGLDEVKVMKQSKL